ncbi:hypothetical protein J4477_03305, partial [Candidatus Pacearchaeota archaeon]|nr:hypothetical protein [Candidatus Pacearchaeota archaeon]
IKAIDIEKIDGEVGEILDLKPLGGGSFANTKVISKLIKKTTYVVRKEATEGKEKLIDEINWIKNLPSTVAPYFPKIIDFEINDDNVWYEMEYYDLPTLRHLIINKEIKKEEALYILKILVNFMFNRIYSQEVSYETENYVKEIHLKRIKERLIVTAQKSELMKKVINSKEILINGKKYLNLPKIIKIIENDLGLLKKLEPKFLCMVHGDLHLDNFVVDRSQMPQVKFILLDPRGLNKKYNYCYDLGKIWHSLNGKYDLTHEGLFNMKHSFRDSNFEVKISFSDINLALTYDYLRDELRNFLYKSPFLKKDSNWEMRTYFNEFSHFCSVMPFHLRGDGHERIALALYLRGVKLANDFLDRYSINKKRLHNKSYFNINSFKDYKRASKFFG